MSETDTMQAAPRTPDSVTGREAFEGLVKRHVDFVYAAALRQVRDPHLAADVAQAVFVILQQKLAGLGRDTIMTAWLLRTTRYTCLAALYQERRRRYHEQRAATMREEKQSAAIPDEWTHMIDAAMLKLGDAERTALAGVYFEGLSHRQLAERLGISEAATHKRLQRAIAKLRKVLGGRGRQELSEAAFGEVLGTMGKPRVAPAAVLAGILTGVGGTTPSSVGAIVKGVTFMAKMLKVKTAATILAVVGAGVLATVAVVAARQGVASAPATQAATRPLTVQAVNQLFADDLTRPDPQAPPLQRLEFTGTAGAAFHGTITLASGKRLEFADTLPQTLLVRGVPQIVVRKERKADDFSVAAFHFSGSTAAGSSGAGRMQEITFHDSAKEGFGMDTSSYLP